MVDHAFLSYAHDSDARDRGGIINLCRALEDEVKARSTRQLVILHDKRDIRWGAQWRRFMTEGPANALVLIPVITERYFASAACWEEFDAFRRSEERRGRHDLILPLYYIDVRPASEEADPHIRGWKQEIMERQLFDWRRNRIASKESTRVRRAIAEMAKDLLAIVGTFESDATIPAKVDRLTRRRTAASRQPVRALTMADAPHPAFQLVQRPTETEILLRDTGQAFVLDYTPLMLSQIGITGVVRADFERLVERELMNHRAMLTFDYMSMPMPLVGGQTVFVSKSAERLTLDYAMMPLPSIALSAAWQQLCRSYYVLSRMSYRHNSSLLLNRRERNRAMQLCGEMLSLAEQYLSELARVDVSALTTTLVSRRQNAEACFIQAERAGLELEGEGALADSALGNLAVNLEFALSNIHKILLEHGGVVRSQS